MECSGSLVLNPFSYLDMSLIGPAPQEYPRRARVIGSPLRQEADYSSLLLPLSSTFGDVAENDRSKTPESDIFIYKVIVCQHYQSVIKFTQENCS